MSSCVETFSLTQLKNRKSFLEDQLNIVNNLIENYEKSNNELPNIENNNGKSIKIKLKKSKDK